MPGLAQEQPPASDASHPQTQSQAHPQTQPAQAQPEAQAAGSRFDNRPISRIEIVKPVQVDKTTVLVPLTRKDADFAANQIRSAGQSISSDNGQRRCRKAEPNGQVPYD